MNNNNSYAYAEVLDVLDNMNEIYKKKISKEFIEYMRKNADRKYKKRIISFKPLEKQNLSKETLLILAMINYKFWSKN